MNTKKDVIDFLQGLTARQGGDCVVKVLNKFEEIAVKVKLPVDDVIAMFTLSSNEAMLCRMLENFCEEQGLPLASADEVMLDNTLNEFQDNWLTAFIEMWEIEMSDHDSINTGE